MTIPRDLNLEPNGKTWIVTSTPVSELAALDSVRIHIPKTRLRPGKPELVSRLSGMLAPSRLQLTIPGGKDIMLLFTNTSGDTLRVGYESATKQFFIDRTKAGLSDFYKGFARKLIAPQLGTGGDATMDLWMDHGSLELFADGGRTVMTALFFPRAPFDKLSLESSESMRLGGWDYTLLRSIW